MTRFKIRTKDNGILTAEFAVNSVSELNNQTRGESASINGEFEPLTDLTVASGETYTVESNTFEAYDAIIVDGTLTIDGELNGNSLTINDGGTVNDNGELNINNGLVAGFNTVFEYDPFAGKYTLTETLGAAQKYTEQFSTSTITTLLVGIEPEQNLKDRNITGKWALIDNVTDNRNQALSTNRLGISVTILEELDNYTDHTAVENALKL